LEAAGTNVDARSLRQVSRRLAGQSVAYALASAVGPITGVLLLPIYTRYLAPADFGLIAMFEILTLIFTTVFSLGLTAMIPFYYVDHQPGQSRRRGIGAVIVAVTMLNLVLVALVTMAGERPVRLLLPSVPFWPFVPILALTALFEPYWIVAGSIYQIQEQASRYARWSTARLFLSIGLKVWFVVVLAQGVYGFVTSSLIAAIVMAAAAAPLLWREMEPAWDPAEIRRAFAVGGPTVPNNLFSYGFRVLDRVILERFVGLGEIGLYYFAVRLADIMRLASDVFINAWRPVFFKEAAHRDFVDVTVPAVIRLGTIAMIGGGLAVALFSRELLAMLSTPAYAGAAKFVPLLAAAMVVKGVYSFPYLAVWYRKKTIWVPMLTAVTMVFSIAANLALTPIWGAWGAAAVQFVSYLVLFALMWMLAERAFPLRYPWREMSIAAAAGGVAAVVGAGLQASTTAIGVKLALMAGYCAIVGLSGGIRAGELRMLVRSDVHASRAVTVEGP
jgi:O-antigen/teichoic acid export membrane protein